MNEEKTTLQRITEQKAEQMRSAIEKAIDEGAKIEECETAISVLKCCCVDGLYLQKYINDGSISVVLHFKSEKIAKVFEPSKDDLEKMAEQKRAELEEIENKLKQNEQ